MEMSLKPVTQNTYCGAWYLTGGMPDLELREPGLEHPVAAVSKLGHFPYLINGPVHSAV